MAPELVQLKMWVMLTFTTFLNTDLYKRDEFLNVNDAELKYILRFLLISVRNKSDTPLPKMSDWDDSIIWFRFILKRKPKLAHSSYISEWKFSQITIFFHFFSQNIQLTLAVHFMLNFPIFVETNSTKVTDFQNQNWWTLFYAKQ